MKVVYRNCRYKLPVALNNLTVYATEIKQFIFTLLKSFFKNHKIYKIALGI